MDRLAKGVRVAGGLLLFANLAACFLPVTKIVQEPYYPAENPLLITPFNYIRAIFQKNADLFLDSYSTKQLVLILCLMALPVLLSLAAGIIGIVGSPRQIVSGIFAIVIAGIYGALLPMMDHIWPAQLLPDQEYQWGYALFLTLGVSVVSAVLGIIGFFVRPRKPKKTAAAVIPQVNEIKQEQEMARYNITEPAQTGGDQNRDMSQQPAPKGGVMTGLTGIYAGASIPFQDGESVKLGRMPDNDLVFDNQPRVSRNHCVITWHAGEGRYEIVDYSSNGSYINDEEECLPQNMKIVLQPGTILDIGSKENRFRLE